MSTYTHMVSDFVTVSIVSYLSSHFAPLYGAVYKVLGVYSLGVPFSLQASSSMSCKGNRLNRTGRKKKKKDRTLT